MNAPIDPPANEPILPESKPILVVEPKIEKIVVAEPEPFIADDLKVVDADVLESKPDQKNEQKNGQKNGDTQKPTGVFTKGLRVCGNCGTELLGETCYRCGQPTKGLVRQFSSIIGDFLDTVLNIDTRVFRTLGPLIVKPGFLTQEYFSGRRIRYVSPVRLFFFLAVLTFLLAQFSLPDDIGTGNNENFVQIDNTDNGKIGKAKTIKEVEKLRTDALAELAKAKREAGAIPMVGAALAKAKNEVNSEADKRVAELKKQMPTATLASEAPAKTTQTSVPATAKPELDQDVSDIDDEGNISFNGEAWHPEKNPIKLEWVPSSVNSWFNSLAQRATNNGKRISKEPKVIIEAVLSSLPMTLFIMLPVFALLLKLMFIFKRRLYMEHLIVALHSHAFLMLSILMLILFNDMITWFSGTPWITVPFGILTALLWIWMPIYLFLMQKRVYQQGWFLSFIKYAVIGNFYIVLLTMAIACTLVIKMIWL